MKAKFVKTYSNHVGRKFMRFECIAEGVTLHHDICVREGRNDSELYTRKEAKEIAIQRHAQAIRTKLL